MALHLLKVCVGIESIEHLTQVQKERRGRRKVNYHFTRQMPQRAEEIVGSGSLYWIIKGLVRVRQPIVAIDSVVLEEDGRYCRLSLAPALVATDPQPRRPHQGWRYLTPEDAPADLGKGPQGKGGEAMPPELLAELRSLGLL